MNGPFHPREPSPLEVALLVLDPWNWLRLGLAISWRAWIETARRLP